MSAGNGWKFERRRPGRPPRGVTTVSRSPRRSGPTLAGHCGTTSRLSRSIPGPSPRNRFEWMEGRVAQAFRFRVGWSACLPPRASSMPGKIEITCISRRSRNRGEEERAPAVGRLEPAPRSCRPYVLTRSEAWAEPCGTVRRSCVRNGLGNAAPCGVRSLGLRIARRHGRTFPPARRRVVGAYKAATVTDCRDLAVSSLYEPAVRSGSDRHSPVVGLCGAGAVLETGMRDDAPR